LLLNNLITVSGTQPVNIGIYGEKIMSMGVAMRNVYDPFQVHFSGAMALPGLINSHDHLDFNCFSVLGEKKYGDYTEWGKHIHQDFKEKIKSVLRVPENLRTDWGIYKNLLAGVTTVVNHGKFLKIENPLIDIFQEAQNLHSVGFEKNWKWKLNNPFWVNKDCVIHTGEGTGQNSSDEIDNLIKYNLLKRKLVAVHGVAMLPEQAAHFKGLVWCPESNRVLLGRHARISELKNHTAILFGSDSTLSGNWNIWRHLRLARSLQQLNDEELLNSLTSVPARLWNLNKGRLEPKSDADIVILKIQPGNSAMDTVFNSNPEDILMVVQKGKIRLFDKSLLPQIRLLPVNLFRYSQLSIQGKVKFVEGELPGLITEIKRHNPDIRFPVEVFETINLSHYD
jgi:cytosine/adenosine deaminase-related metal-dependent hydrolase